MPNVDQCHFRLQSFNRFNDLSFIFGKIWKQYPWQMRYLVIQRRCHVLNVKDTLSIISHPFSLSLGTAPSFGHCSIAVSSTSTALAKLCSISCSLLTVSTSLLPLKLLSSKICSKFSLVIFIPHISVPMLVNNISENCWPGFLLNILRHFGMIGTVISFRELVSQTIVYDIGRSSYP